MLTTGKDYNRPITIILVSPLMLHVIQKCETTNSLFPPYYCFKPNFISTFFFIEALRFPQFLKRILKIKISCIEKETKKFQTCNRLINTLSFISRTNNQSHKHHDMHAHKIKYDLTYKHKFVNKEYEEIEPVEFAGTLVSKK